VLCRVRARARACERVCVRSRATQTFGVRVRWFRRPVVVCRRPRAWPPAHIIIHRPSLALSFRPRCLARNRRRARGRDGRPGRFRGRFRRHASTSSLGGACIDGCVVVIGGFHNPKNPRPCFRRRWNAPTWAIDDPDAESDARGE